MSTTGTERIPGGSLTLSKGLGQWIQHTIPQYIERADGAYLWDENGRRYLDLCGAHGPVILGYQHPDVDAAIVRQLHKGITFTLKHWLEQEAAARVCAMVPGAEQVRFMKSGSDACSVAVRLARIHTARDDGYVVSSGYHGWHDWTLSTAAWTAGIPSAIQSLTIGVPFADLGALCRAFENHVVACVIVDCAQARNREQLQAVIDMAHEYGALAILDEVVTGFRLAPGGAQEHYGVQGDLACFGKALGNGMPISAVTGPEEIMRDILWASATHWGETLSLAAACATLDVIEWQSVPEHLWELGRRFIAGVRRAIRANGLEDIVEIDDLAPRTIITIREPIEDGYLRAKSLVQQEMAKRGVLWNGVNFMTYAHTPDDIDHATNAFDESLRVLASALPDDIDAAHEGPARRAQRRLLAVENRLDGPPIRPPFQ